MIIYSLIVVEGFRGKHCNAYIAELDTASIHECFVDKDIYMDSNNVLFANDNLDVNDECKFIY